jgi:hypothetical protein
LKFLKHGLRTADGVICLGYYLVEKRRRGDGEWDGGRVGREWNRELVTYLVMRGASFGKEMIDD